MLNHFGIDVNGAMKQPPRLKLSCQPTSSSRLKYMPSPVLFSGMQGRSRALRMISLVSQGWSYSGVSVVRPETLKLMKFQRYILDDPKP